MRGLLSLPCLLLVLLVGLPSAAPHGEVLFDFVTSKLEAGLGRQWNLSLTIDAPLVPQTGSKDADLVASLPSQPEKSNAKQYAGYITVDEKAGRHLFYYFSELQGRNATQVPLMLWINGAPGCSSVGGGAFLQNGPFLVNRHGNSIYVNRDSWSEAAYSGVHMLYLDTPVGTGFSYSETPADYERYNDLSIAEDNLKFIVNWLERFPEYKGRDLYLAGEGFAASYIAQLAQLILNHNQASKGTILKLSGLALGNPFINSMVDLFGAYDNLWSHGMLNGKLMDNVLEYCNGKTQKRCKNARAAVADVVRPLYLYDLTADVCMPKPPRRKHDINDLYECAERDVEKYLGSPEVQKALHVNPAAAPKIYKQCNSHVTEVYTEIIHDTTPILKNILANKVRILVYSGDADAVIPTISTRNSIRDMQLKRATAWKTWDVEQTLLGGFCESFEEGLAFATLRGAGHKVGKTHGWLLQETIALWVAGYFPLTG